MNIYLYIYSENPAAVSVNGKFIGETGAEPVKFYTDDKAVLYFLVYPLNINCLPFAFKFEQGKESPAYTAIAYKTSRCDIRIKSIANRIYLPPKLLGTESVLGYTATLFADSYNQLAIQREGYTFSHILPDNLYGMRLKGENVNTRAVFAVSGKLGDEYYMLIVRIEEGEAKVILEEFADKITQEGDKITLIQSRLDICGRADVTVLSGDDFSVLDKYTAYLSGAPKQPAKEQLPIALFEAVKSSDFSVVSGYMTDDLRRIMTDKKLAEFFADYVEIADNKLSNQPGSFIVIDKNNVASIFIAKFKNNLIDNFEEQD